MLSVGLTVQGKSTLLNFLSSQLEVSSKSRASGQLTVNGTASSKAIVQQYFAYVRQDDFFFETLTPREILNFYAALKLPASASEKERLDRVETVINALGLRKCADTRVGGVDVAAKGLSGGEKKRLAIGAELITNPSVMFLDEPTVGIELEVFRDAIRLD